MHTGALGLALTTWRIRKKEERNEVVVVSCSSRELLSILTEGVRCEGLGGYVVM